MRILSLIAVVVFVSSLAAPARAGMAEDCKQELDLDLKIGGCTAAIRSGQWQGKGLAWAYYYRGNAYNDLGEYRRAIKDYDQALRLNPDHTYAYFNRGNAYNDLGEYRRAIEDYDQALRLDPGDADAYNNRGYVYAELGEHAQAIEDYDQSLRLDPDNVQTHQNRGNSYRFLGHYERAAIDWEQAIRFHGPSQARWWQNHLKGKGYYAGAIDGVFNPELSRGLRTCARDPTC